MRFQLCISAAVLSVACGLSLAQSRSSFQNVDGFTAIAVTQNSALSYMVTLDANPMVRVAGIDYPVTSVFGFWNLSDDDNFTTATGTGFGVWSFDRSSAGAGDIAGWKTNPNTGILPNGSETFVYSGFTSAQSERYGLHITTAEVVPGQQGLTFYATGPFIPTPGSAALLAGAGVLGLRRRRR